MAYVPPWMPGDALDIGLDGPTEPEAPADPDAAEPAGQATEVGAGGAVGVNPKPAGADAAGTENVADAPGSAPDPGPEEGPPAVPEPDDGRRAGALEEGAAAGRHHLEQAETDQAAATGTDAAPGDRETGDGPAPERARSHWTTAAALAGVVACVAGGFALGGGFSTVLHAPEAGADAAAGECVEEIGHESYRGSGPGSPSSPTGVVAAFEHAYYVQRDAEAAVALTTPDSGISATHLDLDGIARLPAGTRHCVDVQAVDAQHLEVVLTELRPGAAAVEIHQRIAVRAQDDGGYLIAAIEHTAAG